MGDRERVMGERNTYWVRGMKKNTVDGDGDGEGEEMMVV